MPESDITELVRMWIAGWTVSRGSAEPVDRPWGWSIDVGAPAGEVARHVLPAPTEADVRKLAETITAPHTWLKLFAAGDSVRPWLGPQWRQDAAAFLMTVELTPERPTVPDGYTVTTWERGGVLRTLVRDEAGHQAARGQAGLAGPVAVPDQIVTSADHRRRGLGSVVMRTLQSAAYERGARTGVLVGSAEGQALYATLGWTTHATMASLVLEPTNG
ncbi:MULTISPECIES: GNAT family N-acetyltransferase [Kitasatospora]|uniref:GNAT superfamily N-acetyltransferase n=2 Tax=Kitasatospora TaxID=2063 RepID=A0ABT1J2J7_9ACTN|nr:GNAT family N-acetyltransferase [Kitasatospora paracochleata]MCP2311661.1 GNAT superfamily N-acetyltransferase [Kitasatospora paracochleata]